MAKLCVCSKCGHEQYVGYQAVDGRLRWWASCDKCGKPNIGMAPLDPALLEMLRSFGRASEDDDDAR